jgi:hypothetical protein
MESEFEKRNERAQVDYEKKQKWLSEAPGLIVWQAIIF